MGLYIILSTVLLALCCSDGHAFLLRRDSLLHLWSSQVEVSAKTLRMRAGHHLSVTCDGATSGYGSHTSLSWYGPDRHIIAYEGQHNRVSSERAQSSRFLQIHFRPLVAGDSGRYICRGQFGQGSEVRVQYRYFNLIVDQSQPTRSLRTAPATVNAETTTTPSAGRTTTTASVPDATSPLAIIQTTTAENCTAPKFLCDEICFEARYRCDKFPDCSDRSDEAGCDVNTCSEGQISCDDGSRCITPDLVCNSNDDCPDGSDERNCA